MAQVSARRVAALLLALVLVTAHAEGVGAKLFVSPDGSDGNPGTKERPFRTLKKALSVVEASGIITLSEGVYREGDLLLRRGGTPGHPLVIQGAEGQSALVKGSEEVAGWRPDGDRRWRLDAWTVNSQQLFCDGLPLQQIGARSPLNARHVRADTVCLPPIGKDLNDLTPGSFWYDQDGHALYCMLHDGSDPNKHVMEASVYDRVLSGWGVSHVTVRNLTLMHCNQTAQGWTNGLLNLGSSHWTIEDCRIERADFAGIAGGGDSHAIRRCTIANCGAVGLTLNGSDRAHDWKWRPDREPQNCLFEDLVLKRNNYRNFCPWWEAGGMKCIPSCRNVTVRRCTVTENYGPGIWFDGCLGGILIEDNFLSGNRTGIFYEISAPAEGDPYGALVRNNRVTNTVHQAIYISASEGCIVEDNTCCGNWADIVLHGMPRQALGRDCPLRNNVVRNNILFGGGEMGHLILYTGEGAAGNVVDGNFYETAPEGAGGARPILIGLPATERYDPRPIDLQTLFKETGLEEHGLCGDPMFMDAANGDFSLRAGSPATGKGWRRGQ